MHHDTDEIEETTITSIRATDLSLGLGRLPAGFYIAVHHSDLVWRTENKPTSVNDDDVEWTGSIPIPSALTATVDLEVYASFELQPMLGDGEQLRKLALTTEQLLDRGEGDVTFAFPKDGDVVRPCSSISVTVKQYKRQKGDPSIVDGPHSSNTDHGELEDATNQGHNALLRYRKRGERRDLEQSIEQFTRALQICPLDHPGRAAAESNLAIAKFILCLAEDGHASFDDSLYLYGNALGARPVGHLDRPATLIQLAAMYLARSKGRKDQADGVRAEALLREAVELSHADSHENRAAKSMLQLYADSERRAGPEGQSVMDEDSTSCMMYEDLQVLVESVRLVDRFVCFGDLQDLEQAIATLRELVASISVSDERYLAASGELGVALSHRFEHLGEPKDLEEAISLYRAAINLVPDDHPGKSSYLNNLGNSLFTRFECLGELRDLEDAISTQKAVVDLASPTHAERPSWLNNLSISFRTRFECLGEPCDLEQAISNQMAAVNLTPDGHPHKPGRLNNLGNSLRTRFERLGRLSDLHDAISTQMAAIDLIPDNHPHKPGCLSNLGISFITRFECLGELEDIEEAISAHRVALRLTPDGHPSKPGHLSTLGNSFWTRFERLGELSDLEEAISYHKAALDLTPNGHPHKPRRLDNLGNSLFTRFERLGNLSDIEDAISTHKAAVHLTPDGHPDKLDRLNNLGNSLSTRFQRLGELSDIEDAISNLRAAVNLAPNGHPHKPGFLSNLGTCFSIRLEHLGELSDLEVAISNFKVAVDLTPDGHPDKPSWLNNLGNSFFTRFKRLGELRDLEDAISAYKAALHVAPQGHPREPIWLNNLGISSRTRFEHFGEPSDLEEAMSTQRRAVDLTPNDHPDKPSRLNNLGNSLLTRFELLGESSDLEGAISAHQAAVDLTPNGHPHKPRCLINLGNCFLTRFERLGELTDIENAISAYLHAASSPFGPVGDRFGASQKWILCARRIGHHSLLHAYSVSVGLLPQLAWIGLSLSHRYSQLVPGADLVRDAAAAALDSGFPETAVEWLEQGRSIVWGELLQLRSSYDELSIVHSDHARRLRALSAQLEHASVAREHSLSMLSDGTQSATHGAPESLQQEVDRHRKLAIERDKLLQEIRRLPGFQRFLLQRQFSQLRASAHSGPVVILNAAARRCDALIVLHNVDHAIHVPLTHFSFERSVGLQKALKGVVRHTREGEVVIADRVSWETFLSPLWKCVVRPVLNALAFSLTPPDLVRIFWCPTGPLSFLPLHAAGFYDSEYSSPGHKVFDFVVSSYVPTLSILAPSSSTPAVTPNNNPRVLLVPQPSTDGHPRLPGVVEELAHIRGIIKDSPSACEESHAGTVEEVLALMKETDWVHFACHGIQAHVDSGLCLADQRRLKLRDIVALSRPRGGLAFLSACQTATGDVRLSDEAIHMSAGMLFAGYGGVVGTMWSISDRLAPVVARDVYEYLFRKGSRPDYREAARALHEAIAYVRDHGMASFDEWVPFIHVGL